MPPNTLPQPLRHSPIKSTLNSSFSPDQNAASGKLQYGVAGRYFELLPSKMRKEKSSRCTDGVVTFKVFIPIGLGANHIITGIKE